MLRTFNRKLATTAIRTLSHTAETTQSSIRSDGHYDIIIVGGGAAGISLAGSIGRYYLIDFSAEKIHIIYFRICSQKPEIGREKGAATGRSTTIQRFR